MQIPVSDQLGKKNKSISPFSLWTKNYNSVFQVIYNTKFPFEEFTMKQDTHVVTWRLIWSFSKWSGDRVTGKSLLVQLSCGLGGPSLGIFLVTENKRREDRLLEAIWCLWCALIPAICLYFSHFGNCHIDELLSSHFYSWVQV